jgi:hypothetical protein
MYEWAGMQAHRDMEYTLTHTYIEGVAFFFRPGNPSDWTASYIIDETWRLNRLIPEA